MSDLSGQIRSIKHAQEEQATKNQAQVWQMPYVNLSGYPVNQEALLKTKKADWEKLGIVPYLKVGQIIKVATAIQPSPSITNFLKSLFSDSEIEFSLCSRTSLDEALSLYDGYVKAQASHKLQQTKKTGVQFAKMIKKLEDVAINIRKVSTSELLDLVVNGAVITGSSDVHLEPTKNNCRLRFRIDGILKDTATLSSEQYRAILSRIKNLAEIKLDINAKPQDGRFSMTASGKPIDIRVSTMPGPDGENVVMRLLLSESQLLQLKDLDFSPEIFKLIQGAISQPNGMILNTGPTGSGKTTTLYAILSELNKPPVKIITIEDPIEYKIPGIDQTQVDALAGYTFSNALSSAVRQDPDILMVGEIRDTDTAKIALQASLTGHLVLSTLHTNTASGAIPRLLDMGIEPYLLAGSINLIIAQRLVRRICYDCAGKNPKCEICQGSGYKGRVPIVEALLPSTEFNELITRKASIEEFENKAKALGMKTMLADGMEKVSQGITTKEEIDRVTE